MSAKNLKLRFLCILHRHGDRAPVKFFPSDPNKNHWKEGESNLTRTGKLEMYNLGKLLRQRYDDFLGDKYPTGKIQVRSTDVDRCLMSVQCCLASMFPPTGEDVIAQGLHWQPFPIHTVPQKDDPFAMFIPSRFQHPPNGKFKLALFNEIYDVVKKNQEMLNYVDDLAECNGSFEDQIIAMNTIMIERNNNLPIPQKVESHIDSFTELFNSLIFLHSANHRECLLPTSHMLQDILRNIESLRTKRDVNKTFIYSAHDVSVIAMIFALTEQMYECPTASCLMMEFHEDLNCPSDFYFKLFFINDHNKEPIQLKLRHQKDSTCSFETFKQTAEEFINNNQHLTENGHK